MKSSRDREIERREIKRREERGETYDDPQK